MRQAIGGRDVATPGKAFDRACVLLIVFRPWFDWKPGNRPAVVRSQIDYRKFQNMISSLPLLFPFSLGNELRDFLLKMISDCVCRVRVRIIRSLGVLRKPFIICLVMREGLHRQTIHDMVCQFHRYKMIYGCDITDSPPINDLSRSICT